MAPDKDMPPDPWAEEGVDLWALEQAERLAHDGVTGDDPRWRALEDDGPLIDDFDDSVWAPQTRDGRADTSLRQDSWRFAFRVIAIGLVALVLVVAVLLMYVR